MEKIEPVPTGKDAGALLPQGGIRPATAADLPGLEALHRAVARAGGGIARTEGEITAAYIEQVFSTAGNG
ncbi:MAG TPA: hypothetical protein VHK69_12675, partial [Chitinophagaceae bacterium]|nr:hypothetical protein [Chitinophagaceae bacterium]